MTLARFKAKNHPQQVRERVSTTDPTLFATDDLPGVLTDEVDDRGTTPDFFAALNAEFGFTVDVAASDANFKVARYYTVKQNGLLQSWDDEVVWCNPPFSDIAPWVRKAWDSTATVVMLVPANRTEQRWWQELVEPHRDNGGRLPVRFIAGRLRFMYPGQFAVRPNDRPPFGCALLVWRSAPPAISERTVSVGYVHDDVGLAHGVRLIERKAR